MMSGYSISDAHYLKENDMDLTVLQQGRFTSTGAAKTLQIRSDLDWMWVYNYTQAATTQATGRGVQFYWQRGMSNDTGIEYKKTNNTDALNMVTLTSGGFTLVDSSVNIPGTLRTNISAISDNVTPPVVSLNNTYDLSNGDIVRLYSVTDAAQLNGVDFTIGALSANTSFTLAYMSALANGEPGTTASFRRIPYEPLYYPRNRYISAVTSSGSSTVVKMTVTHAFTVGQAVRFIVPSTQVSGTAIWGMTDLDGRIGNITAVDTVNNTITVDIDSSGFTAFTFPTNAQAEDLSAFTYAQVVPVGEADFTTSVIDPNRLDDATVNTGYIGIKLAGGAQSPAGSNNDVIYWTAGRSFSVDNQ